MKITPRDVPPRSTWALEQAGVHPLLARLFAARGVRSADELDDTAAKLLPPSELKGTQDAARLLADAIAQNLHICVVADYDCDGATACAVALRGLKMLGAAPEQVSFVVPDRALHGYGLTPPIVDLVRAKNAQVLVTVDNGMASHEAVDRARALGIQVLITDHHLPVIDTHGAVSLPQADVIVNPNQPDSTFTSKAPVGVGRVFPLLPAPPPGFPPHGALHAPPWPRPPASPPRPPSTPSPWEPPPRGAPWTPTTAAWSAWASNASAPGACSRALLPCSPPRAATRPKPPARTSASRWARASTRRAAWPRWAWASNAC